MTESIRTQALAALQGDWAAYVERLQRLPPEAQSAFLSNQGYARPADLLAHIAAWWQDGIQAINRLIEDPNFSAEEYDVDAFNARAVAAAHDLDEAAVIASFEDTRQRMVRLVTSLPEAAFDNERIAARVKIEVIGHLGEHALAGD